MGFPGQRPEHNRLTVPRQDWASLPGPLREAGEIASTRLGLALSDALKRAAEQLQAQGDQAAAPLEQAALLDAAQFARSRQLSLAEDFRKRFEERYLRACRPKSALLMGYALDFDVRRLEIVAHDHLEESLDPTSLQEAIRSRCAASLHALAQPYRDLLDIQDLQPGDIPAGPKTIARAFADALGGQFSRVETKQRVARALSRHWPESIDGIYRDLKTHLDAPAAAERPVPDKPGEKTGKPSGRNEGAPAPGPALLPARETPQTLAAAREAVTRITADGRLPRVIVAFLAGPWQLLLARIHAVSGDAGADWRQAVQTMEELAWSLSVRTARDERDRLVRVLPDLVKRLAEGLDRLGTPEEVRAPFFASLTKYHLKLVNLSGLIAGVGAAETPTSVPASSKPGEDAAAAPPEAPLPAGHGPDTGLDGLEIGTWIEFAEADGGRSELKLAWVSAGSKLYLLTNRQGRRALSLNAVELAGRLRNGSARILSPAPRTALPADAPLQDKKTA